ncbi:hypothetical protein GCM10027275_16890 [Rhabdobacter roseus]|uniref:Cell division protein FtsW (Lipid II flippase) n=1 Tax=Rhabdobacter roseus TaxID=1655419 RepID=A0A840TQU7_9BACT|nr:hypothetical protein [Rhabdobacter roseus]MBB5283613.1 cell division protein FtsW (lipid II flippase) [Rhabdobacter roseus]
MDTKKLFAILLTILGIGGLVYTAVQILDSQPNSFKTLLVVGILGLIFFSSGIKLLTSIRDA